MLFRSGKKFSGEYQIDGEYYYFDPNKEGEMTTGWAAHDGNKYYYDKDGHRVSGWYQIGDIEYYFAETTGIYVEGFVRENGAVYFYLENGKKYTGEKKIDGSWYYFNPTNGGKMMTGWCNLTEKTGGTKRVYYGSDGVMCYGEKKISGKWYYFNTVTGKMTTGWCNLPGKKVYYGSDGAMCYGEKKISGKWYYFNTVTGKMTTGWCNLPGKKVYYGSDGAMVYGWQTIGGVRYYFNKTTGALEQTSAMARKAQGYSSSTKWLILVDTKSNHVGIYNGSKNNWVEKKYWSCTSGAASTPTVKGTFTVQSKGLAFGHGYTCWYYTQFYGNYLFHSVLYNPGSKTSIQDGRLGINASHGCVRLSLANAKWIYDNIPSGTKVVVY